VAQRYCKFQQHQADIPPSTALAAHYAKRYVQTVLPYLGLDNKPLKQLQQIAEAFHQWQLKPWRPKK
jgi:hypothetical protein